MSIGAQFLNRFTLLYSVFQKVSKRVVEGINK